MDPPCNFQGHPNVGANIQQIGTEGKACLMADGSESVIAKLGMLKMKAMFAKRREKEAAMTSVMTSESCEAVTFDLTEQRSSTMFWAPSGNLAYDLTQLREFESTMMRKESTMMHSESTMTHGESTMTRNESMMSMTSTPSGNPTFLDVDRSSTTSSAFSTVDLTEHQGPTVMSKIIRKLTAKTSAINHMTRVKQASDEVANVESAAESTLSNTEGDDHVKDVVIQDGQTKTSKLKARALAINPMTWKKQVADDVANVESAADSTLSNVEGENEGKDVVIQDSRTVMSKQILHASELVQCLQRKPLRMVLEKNGKVSELLLWSGKLDFQLAEKRSFCCSAPSGKFVISKVTNAEMKWAQGMLIKRVDDVDVKCMEMQELRELIASKMAQ